VIDIKVSYAQVEIETLEDGLSEQPSWRFLRRRAIREALADARQRQRELEALDDGE
jgi:hypothetical protein